MNAMTEMSKFRHEKVLFVNNEKAGLKAIIAVHHRTVSWRKLLSSVSAFRIGPPKSE